MLTLGLFLIAICSASARVRRRDAAPRLDSFHRCRGKMARSNWRRPLLHACDGYQGARRARPGVPGSHLWSAPTETRVRRLQARTTNADAGVRVFASFCHLSISLLQRPVFCSCLPCTSRYTAGTRKTVTTTDYGQSSDGWLRASGAYCSLPASSAKCHRHHAEQRGQGCHQGLDAGESWQDWTTAFQYRLALLMESRPAHSTIRMLSRPRCRSS